MRVAILLLPNVPKTIHLSVVQPEHRIGRRIHGVRHDAASPIMNMIVCWERPAVRTLAPTFQTISETSVIIRVNTAHLGRETADDGIDIMFVWFFRRRLFSTCGRRPVVVGTFRRQKTFEPVGKRVYPMPVRQAHRRRGVWAQSLVRRDKRTLELKNVASVPCEEAEQTDGTHRAVHVVRHVGMDVNERFVSPISDKLAERILESVFLCPRQVLLVETLLCPRGSNIR